MDVTLLNDLIPDCDHSEDKPLLRELLDDEDSSWPGCSKPHQFPCFRGHSHCFIISDICVFKLDSLGNLYPCRNGAHLEVCENFTCNNKFKCPAYYCVPFGYLCDGESDCPSGEDEAICDEHLDCSDMYRRRGTKQCSHLNDICDNNVDCMNGDDEAYCQLYYVECPSGCICLFFALYCTNISTDNLKDNNTVLRYSSLVIKGQSLMNVKSIFKHFPYVVIVTFSDTNLTDICSTMSDNAILHAVNLTFNRW